MSLFSLPEVSTERRITCAVSGAATILAVITAFAAFISAIYGVFWLWKNTAWFYKIPITLAILTVWSLGCIVARFIADDVARRREIERPLYDWEIEHDLKTRMIKRQRRKQLAGIFARVTGKALLWLFAEMGLMYLLAQTSAMRELHGALMMQKSATADMMVFSIVLQIMFAGIGILIWKVLDNRKSIADLDRATSTFTVMLIPLWAGVLAPTLGVWLPLGWLICFFGSLPIVGMILGGAYSCEKNIFDMMGLRR